MHLSSTYFVPGSVLDTETARVKVDRVLSFMELTFELGKASKTQTTEYIIYFN